MVEIQVKSKVIISNTDIVEKSTEDGQCVYYFNNKKLEKKIPDGKTEIEIAEGKIVEIINKFLNRQYDNTIVLTGAGSSILREDDIEEEIEEGFDILSHSGKTVYGLKEAIEEHLNQFHVWYSLDELAEKVKYVEDDNGFNIEDLLSKVQTARDYISENEREKFDLTVNEIEKKIRSLCEITMCQYHKHREFINKLVTKRKAQSRVKIFTTNYDTLFEQALQREEYILVDGFSYEFPRKFNARYFDYDFIIRGENKIIDEPEYVDKVVHLLKIHGSIDWKKSPQGDVIKSIEKDEQDQSLMIYPRRAKFEQSYENPYFDLFSRFQNELRKKNTLLIVIGFSFADKHIKSIVKNAILNNVSLNILIVSPDIEKDEYKDFIERAKKYQNVMLFGATFNKFVSNYRKQNAYSDDLF
ncbi:SIR2 family protein, partial [Bacillus sp. JJ1503]|uniref:SIR2 family protein n=1 Tax=Bacillus sp. JJ1503 TaxID=3122956 RepID=UPI002FFF14A8